MAHQNDLRGPLRQLVWMLLEAVAVRHAPRLAAVRLDEHLQRTVLLELHQEGVATSSSGSRWVISLVRARSAASAAARWPR